MILTGALLAVAGCKVSRQEPTEAPGAAASAPKAAPKGTLCTRLEGDGCADPAERFKHDVTEIHVVYTAPEVPEKAKMATITWIAEDVGTAAPKGYKIATANAALKGLGRKDATHVTVKGKLTRPTNGWPPGRYQVEIRIEGRPVFTRQFTIETAS